MCFDSFGGKGPCCGLAGLVRVLCRSEGVWQGQCGGGSVVGLHHPAVEVCANDVGLFAKRGPAVAFVVFSVTVGGRCSVGQCL